MFVGFEIKSNQNQAKVTMVSKDFTLSQAVLDPASVKNKNKEPVCLLTECNKKQFLVAVLDPNQSWQCPLNLMFAAGSQLKFFIRGQGTVHLTGFEHPDEFDDDLDMSDIEESEEEEEDDEELADKKALVVPTKKVATTNGHGKGSAKKSPGKKSPAKKFLAQGPSSSDESDDDFMDYAGQNESDSDEDMSDEDQEDEDDDDDDDDELGDLDSDDDDELGELDSDDE